MYSAQREPDAWQPHEPPLTSLPLQAALGGLLGGGAPMLGAAAGYAADTHEAAGAITALAFWWLSYSITAAP